MSDKVQDEQGAGKPQGSSAQAKPGKRPKEDSPSSSSAHKSMRTESVAEPTTESKSSERAGEEAASGSGSISSLRGQPNNGSSDFGGHHEATNDPTDRPYLPKLAPAQEVVEPFRITDIPEVRYSRVLILNPGQGGTFGYGDRFKDEDGNLVTAKESEAAASKIMHLDRYGAKLIGTKDCVTCLGVYFELEGNRVFCAHINAWHNVEDGISDGLVRWTAEYAEIRKQICDALVRHSVEHGWSRDSVKMDTVIITCPKPEETAFAVPDAIILDFLGLERPQYPKDAHGFLSIPGVRTDEGKPQVQLLMVEYEDQNGDRMPVYEDMPVQLDEVHYVNPDYSFVEQQWTYTAGVGFHTR